MEVEEVIRTICAIYDPSTSNSYRLVCTQVRFPRYSIY
ncbi:unnamed protein product [Haemonchus placei]|uniref:HTH_48 domain-containing protein n=1 Tax=Haemonchus placei TaxID=6290 RepID=A0A0N4WGR4_HAEPC|nr:unnamed protein product [Haemonchus placei]